MTVLADALQLRAAAAVADELANALAAPPPRQAADDHSPTSPLWRNQSLSKGAAGVAVLHGIRTQHGLSGLDRVHAWLTRATGEDLSAGPGAGLWFGAPAVAFAISTAAPGQYAQAMASLDVGVTALVTARLDAAFARMDAAVRPSLSEFDLVHGLAGLGAYLLARDPDGDLVRRVLAYLVRLTEPVPADDQAGLSAPGWWTGDIPHANTNPAFAARRLAPHCDRRTVVARTDHSPRAQCR